jgi:hypothetical protein
MSAERVFTLLDGLRDRGLLDRVECVELDGTKVVLGRPAPEAPPTPPRKTDEEDDFDPYASSHGGAQI